MKFFSLVTPYGQCCLRHVDIIGNISVVCVLSLIYYLKSECHVFTLAVTLTAWLRRWRRVDRYMSGVSGRFICDRLTCGAVGRWGRGRVTITRVIFSFFTIFVFVFVNENHTGTKPKPRVITPAHCCTWNCLFCYTVHIRRTFLTTGRTLWPQVWNFVTSQQLMYTDFNCFVDIWPFIFYWNSSVCLRTLVRVHASLYRDDAEVQ